MTDDTSRRLQELRERYFGSLPERRREVDEAFNRLLSEGWSNDALRELHRHLHMLVGAAGSFSHVTLRNALFPIEEYLGALLEGRVQIAAPDRSLIKAQIDEALALIGPEEEASSPRPRSAAFPGSAGLKSARQRVFIVEDDLEQASHLALQLEQHGIATRVLTQLAELDEALDGESPAAILMDIIFPEGYSAGLEKITDLQKRRDPFPPLVFVSVRTDFQARLQAAHAGASAFFPKPLDVNRLIEHIDEIQTDHPPEPFRVLVVDDDPERAAYRARHLELAGLLVKVSANPLQIMAELVEFRPEVVFVGLHMGECTGLDVTTVVRQEEAYLSLPIVVLGQFDAMQEHLRAAHAGADDYLLGHIDPRLLVCMARQRARRWRKLQRVFVSDGLTGLLTHDAFMVRLEQESLRCQRHGGSVCLAIIDIDRFKQINDTRGHLEGNRVLRTLARPLRGRFRGTDAIGRFGGDELCVLMLNTGLDDAYAQVERIRGQVEQYVFTTETGPYGVTISAGVTEVRFAPNHWRKEAQHLLADADAALYEAKKTRNRVVTRHGPTPPDPMENSLAR